MKHIQPTPLGQPISLACFEKYVGLPWAELGRSWDGVDCWGLRRLIFLHELGIELPSFSDDYATSEDKEVIRSLISGNVEKLEMVAPGEEQPFDGVVLRGHHVGTVVRKGLLIHVSSSTRTSVLQEYRSGLLKHRVVGIYRHQKL